MKKKARVKKWWHEDSSGAVTMSAYRAGRPLELAPGKAAVALANVRELNELLDNLISAVRAGELDEHLARIVKAPRKKKVA